jgi:hypothetical protein
MKLENIQVIIRSIGERTLDLSRLSVLNQGIDKNNIFVINQLSLEEALRIMMENSISNNSKYTIALDADVVLMPDSIKNLVKRIELQADNVFTLQGLAFDYVFGEFRPVGHRIYKNKFFGTALDLIPLVGTTNRPETTMINSMKKMGYRSVQVVDFYGLHAFEQSYFDLYRTSYAHSIKHKDRILRLIDRCHKNHELDEDFSMILRGLADGLANMDQKIPDYSLFKSLFEKVKNFYEIKEKKLISDEEVSDILKIVLMKGDTLKKQKPIFRNTKMGVLFNNVNMLGFKNGLRFTLYRNISRIFYGNE